MSAPCAVVSRRLPLVGDEGSLPPGLDRHVAKCLTCQAETARYRKLGRALGALASTVEPAPPGMVGAVRRVLEREALGMPVSSRSDRITAAAGAVAATAAGVVAVALWRRARQAS